MSLPSCGVCREYHIFCKTWRRFKLKKNRETSNKALNAVNQIGLVPFLMSFLGSKDKLPLSTVTSAGVYATSAIAPSQVTFALSPVPVRSD